jgi:uncharacterized protein
VSEYAKPLPRPTPQDSFHWEGLKRHECLVQQCTRCGELQWYPRDMCSRCGSFDLTHKEVEPTGTVFTYTTQHHGTGSKFDSEVPYTVAVVELTAHPGIRLVGRLELGAEDVHVGLPVVGSYLDATEEVTFLLFRSAEPETAKTESSYPE